MLSTSDSQIPRPASTCHWGLARNANSQAPLRPAESGTVRIEPCDQFLEALPKQKIPIRTPQQQPLQATSLMKTKGSQQNCTEKHDTCRASPVAQLVKNPLANAGDASDAGSILGSGRSPGEGNGNPLQCSCLENSMHRGAWRAIVHGVTKSWTRLSAHMISAQFQSISPKIFIKSCGSFNICP